jgi:hypothetical protein
MHRQRQRHVTCVWASRTDTGVAYDLAGDTRRVLAVHLCFYVVLLIHLSNDTENGSPNGLNDRLNSQIDTP